ncbi:MAG: hypothetical protein PVF83_18425 [Anaerolineales bacterium]|jgi:predicted RNA-binding Zn-ribbon protein involved in translation (DUF1610 family)
MNKQISKKCPECGSIMYLADDSESPSPSDTIISGDTDDEISDEDMTDEDGGITLEVTWHKYYCPECGFIAYSYKEFE